MLISRGTVVWSGLLVLVACTGCYVQNPSLTAVSPEYGVNPGVTDDYLYSGCSATGDEFADLLAAEDAPPGDSVLANQPPPPPADLDALEAEGDKDHTPPAIDTTPPPRPVEALPATKKTPDGGDVASQTFRASRDGSATDVRVDIGKDINIRVGGAKAPNGLNELLAAVIPPQSGTKVQFKDGQVQVQVSNPTTESKATESKATGTKSTDTKEDAAADTVKDQPVLNTSQSWPLFRGNAMSTGVAKGEFPTKPSLLWTFKVDEGAFDGAAAIVDGVVYVADLDGVVYALALKDGKEKWRYTTEPQSGFVAAPAVYDGRVYVGDIDGNFYCLNATTGKAVWAFQTEAEIDSSANFYKGNVLVGSQDATLYAVNAKSGKLDWKFVIDDQIRCSPTVVEGRAFVAGCDAKLHIIDLNNGKSLDEVEIDGPTGATPAVSGDYVYFGSEGGVVHGINWRKARSKWQYRDPRSRLAFRSSPAADGKSVVVGGRSKKVYSLDLATGKENWKFSAKQRVDSSPVIAGKHVYFGSADGRVYGVTLAAGKKVWEFEAGGRGFTASPAIAAGRMVIASDDGVVYCFGAKK